MMMRHKPLKYDSKILIYKRMFFFQTKGEFTNTVLGYKIRDFAVTNLGAPTP